MCYTTDRDRERDKELEATDGPEDEEREKQLRRALKESSTDFRVVPADRTSNGLLLIRRDRNNHKEEDKLTL